jgi:starch synthase
MGDIGGGGLHIYLNRRSADLVGILNGIDTDVWNPTTDKLIEKNYDVNSYKQGKRINKKALQREFLLEDRDDLPIFSFIGRFAEQKGLSLLMGCIDDVMKNMACQFIILGSGDADMERFFVDLPNRHPKRIGSFIGYNERLAHLIEAGSDFFVMPSLYEPCGLNQMYSQVYGTLPIVRAVGGLEDTVDNYDEEWEGNSQAKSNNHFASAEFTSAGEMRANPQIKFVGTGFKFRDISALALYNTIGWAVSTYFDRPNHIDAMIKEAMKKDYSWGKSAKKYEGVYGGLTYPATP